MQTEVVNKESMCHCGKPKNNPRSLLCAECLEMLRDIKSDEERLSSYKKNRPYCSCGRPKDYESKRCYACYIKEVAKPDIYVCPQCGGKKSYRAKVCKECHKPTQAAFARDNLGRWRKKD